MYQIHWYYLFFFFTNFFFPAKISISTKISSWMTLDMWWNTCSLNSFVEDRTKYGGWIFRTGKCTLTSDICCTRLTPVREFLTNLSRFPDPPPRVHSQECGLLTSRLQIGEPDGGAFSFRRRLILLRPTQILRSKCQCRGNYRQREIGEDVGGRWNR